MRSSSIFLFSIFLTIAALLLPSSVSAQSPPQSSVISGLSTVCQGNTGVTYSVTNEPGTTYLWTYSGNGFIKTAGDISNSITVRFSDIATSGELSVVPCNVCGNGPPRTLAINVATANTTISNAGSDIINACGVYSATLSGNNPIVGSGLWTMISGQGTITSPSSSSSGLTNLGLGTNVFRWTISNGTCLASSDDVIINVTDNPSIATANVDQTVCASSTNLAGNIPSTGTGLWTKVFGIGTITSPSSPSSGITGLITGSVTFRWTISNAPCVASSDDIVITRNGSTTIANASIDQTVCATTATLAGNTPTAGTGSWTLVSGTATITSPNAANSGITGLAVGTNVFRWTITNAPCTATSDDVAITRSDIPTTANAGADITDCNISTATLAANIASVGTGSWSLVSGIATITAANSPSSGITGLNIPGTATLRWTISNSPCLASTDDIVISISAIPTAAAASTTPTLCISNVLTNITHATNGATGIGSATGLPAGVTAAWGSNVITISGTPSASGTFNYTIPLTGGCGTVNATGTITVTPANTAAAASSAPTLCISTVLTNITHATTGATGIGTATGLPAGVTAAWGSNVITISGTPSASGTFNYTIPLTGGCGTVNATGTITVTPANTAAAASSAPTLCISTVLTNITHATTGATGIGTATGLPAGVTAAWASNLINIIGTPTASGTFSYSIPLTGGCGAVNATGTITVTPANTAAAASTTPTLCISNVLTNITHATNGATGIGSATGLPAGVTAAWGSNVITISGTPSASGTFNYTIPLTGGCGTVNATGTITVTPANTAAAASSTPTLCISTVLTNITHATTGATGIGTATGLPAGVTAAWLSNVITISGTPSASGTFNYTIPLTGGCGAVNATGTITVTPANTAATASSTPTLCISNVLTNITHATTGATGIGTATGLPAGVTAAWASDVITISGTPTASGTFSYSIPLTGGCGAVNATGTITVTPANTAAAASTTPTLCISTVLTNITHATTGATGIGAATGLPAGVTAAWLSNVITISGTPSASGTFTYSIPLTGGCGSVNATGTITVTPANTAAAASSTPTLCISTVLTNITHATTGATGIGTATGLPAGVTAAWLSNVITISGTPSASGTFNYTIPLTGGCGAVNATGTITVTPANTAATASSTPTLCISNVLTNITHATTGATGIGTATGLPAGVTAAWASDVITISGTPTASGTFTYSILLTGGCGSVNATGTITVTPANTAAAASSTPTLCISTVLTNITHATTGATGIGAATGLPAGITAAWASDVITISGTPTASGTFTYSILLTGGCGSVNATGTITVTPANTAAAASTTPTLCINTVLTNITHATTGATGIGAATSLPAGVTAAWLSNVITISGTPTASGTFSYSIPLTGGCGEVNATGTITVTPANTAAAASATPTLCISTVLTNITHATTGATGIGTATGLPAGITAAWASNVITISGTPSASGTFNYTIPLTGGCGAVNATGTITVTPANTAAAASSTPTLCISTVLTNITHATTGATGIGAATGLPAGITAAWLSNVITISGTPSASGTFNYSIPLTGGCGAVNATGTITVTPANTVAAASSAPTLCISTVLTNITHATTGATGIGAATGLPAGVTAAWGSNVITISGTPSASGTFNYTIPLTGGCGAVNATGTITVTPANTAAAASTTPTLCISTVLTNITHATTGATGIGTATGLPAGITAAWLSNLITISGTPTASGTFNYTIPLTGGCGAVNATGTITVTPANTAAAASATPTLCISTVLTNITHATTGATGIGAATGLPAGVTAAWGSNVITISGTPSASGTFNYTIPLTGGCGTVNATGTITVTPANTAAAASSAPTLCISTVLTNITHATTGATGIGAATSLPAGVTAAWLSNVITISGTPSASGTFNYTIPLTGGCGTVNATGTITVTPANTATAASSAPTLCISTVLTNITHATTGATGIGTATGLPAGVTAAWASNLINIIGTPTASGTFNYTIPLTGGCGAVNATGTITVTPANTAAAASSAPTLCISTVLTNITHATTGATGIGAATGLPAGITAAWASDVITISGTPSASGTFNYTIPLTGGCGAVNATGTITVTPANTAAAASTTPTLCISTVLTNITHATTGATGIGTATGLPAGVTAAWLSNVITISGTPSASGTFTYSIPLTGGCGSVNATGTITVTPANTAAAASSTPTLCISTVLTNITHATTGATGIGTATGLPAGVTAAWLSNVITISGTPSASGTFNYTIPLTGGCGAVNATGTITVTPANTAAAASSTPTLCISNVLTNITHATTGATGIGTATGLPAGVTAAWASDVITISGTPTASGTFTYSILLTGGCGSVNATGTITVTPANTAAAASSTPTLCISTVLTNITHATTGATGIGAATGLPAGITAAWASNVINISGTPSASGTFNYTIPLTGGCGAVNATGTITVTPANTAAAASTTPTLCINTVLTNITHATTGATGIGAATSLPAGVTAAWASNVITISGTPSASGTFNYTIPLTGGCGTVNATGTITVTPANTAAAASTTPTLCISTVLTNITHATTGATGIGAATGLPAGVTAAWLSNVITISGTPSASGTFTYSIPLTGGCGTVNATGTITVTPANTAAAASTTPTLCINTVLTNITHATTGATGIGAATGLPAGVTAAWASDVITISGTPSASGTFNYTIPLTGGCGAVNATGTITVTPANTAAAASSAPTLCISTVLTNITHATTGATGIGAATSLPAGVTAAWLSNVITISGTPSASGTFNYSIPLTGGCGAVNATGTITVTPANTAAAASTTPTLCISTVLTNITHATTGATGIGAATGLPAGVTAAWASNVITINGTPSASGTFNYTIPLTGGCGAVNATGTITVTPANTAAAPSTTPTLCINTVLTNITHATTGATGIGAATGLPAGVTAAWASNVITISGTPSASGTFNYTIPLTGGCGAVNATGTITVTPANTAAAASSTPTLCISTVLTNITHATTGATSIGAATGLPAGVTAAWLSNVITISGTPSASGTFTYSIPLTGGCGSVNATGTITVTPANTAAAASSTPTLCISTVLTNITHATTGATGIGSATGLPAGVTAAWASNVITISGTPSASGTFSYSIPLTGGCGAVNATGTITVTPANTAAAASSTPTLCISTVLTNITHATTGATGIGSATGLPAGVTAAWLSNVITISGTPSASGTFTYSIPLTGGCGSVNATGTITVTPANTAAAASTTPTLCINTVLTNITHATTGATGIGAATGLPAGVTAAWASDVITISGTPSASGTFNYSIPLTGGCGSVNATGTITVTPANTAAAASTTPTLCINTVLTNITHATTGATGIGAATGLPAGVTAAWLSNVITISGTPSASGTFTYSIPLTGGCGSVNATGTITVTPANTAAAASSTPTLCISTVLTNITHATTGATGIGAATGLPAGVTAAWASNVITISGTPSASGTFTYSIPLTGGCGSVNATGTITVTPANTAAAASSTPTLCISTVLTNITHATTGATGIGAATGLPAGVTAAWASNVITISGTPSASGTFTYSIPLTGGCGSVNATGTITVTPANTAAAASTTPTLCISTVLTNITHATTGATGIGAATGLPAGVTAAWLSNVITISGTPSASGTFTYSIPLTGGCGAVNATGTITVTPANTAAAASSTPTLCINTVLTNITHATTGATGIGAATSLPAGVTAAWLSNVITIIGAPSASGTFNYTIPLTGGCGAVNATGTITVTPANTAAAASSTPTLCISTVLTNITHATTGATGIGSATSLPAGVTAAWASNVITISGTPSASGTFNYTIPLTGGCGTVNATGTITVTPANTAAAASTTPTLCISTVLTNITHATTGATGIGAATGLPAGVTAAWLSNVITISGTPSASGTFTYSIPLTGGCGTVNATGTITVTPANTAAAASTTPTLCINTVLTNITHATTGATGIGAATGLPAGVTAAWASDVITISGTPSASGTFNYTIPLTGGCGAVNATGTITVTPANTVAAASSTPTLCISTVLTNITHATTGATGIGAATGLPAGVTAAWGSNVITISGTPSASGTFNYTIPLTGGCGAVNATGTITVTPANTAAAASTTPTLCISTVLTNITHATTGATGIGAATGLPAGITAAWGSNVITISGTPAASGTFTYSILLTGGCGTVNATGTITVTPANTAAAPSTTPTLCISTVLTNITHATTGATGIGAATGLPAGVTAAWLSNVITISGTPSASGTFNYTIPLTGGCGAVNATGTITVTPANTAAAASSAPTLCISTVLTNITHATTGATGIGAATGLPAGITAAWASNVITISGTPSASGTFNYTIPLTGGCGAVNATGTITVTPANTAAEASSTPTLCISTVLTDITHATTGATGIGAATSLPAGITAAWLSNVITISGTPSASGTFNYTIPLTGGCGAVNATGTITVIATPSIANAGSDQTVCATTATLVGNTPTVGTGLWTLVSGTGTISSASAANSGVTGLGVGANVFRWTISNSPCVSSSSNIDDVTITRSDTPSNAAAGSDQTVCATTATLAGNTPTVGTGLWTLVSGTGTISSASAANSGVTGLGVGANVFRWTISNSPCVSSSSNIDDVTITRSDTPSNAAAGSDQTVCATTATLVGNTPSVGTGLWTLVSGTGTISSASAANSGVTGLGVGANVFRWTISNSPCVSSSSNIDDVTITRSDTPSNAAAGSDQTVCATTATLAGNTPTVGTGLWTLVSGTGTISSASAANSGVTGLGVGANVFRWTISNSPCVSSSSNIDDVTITRSDTPSNAAAGTDQTVCATTATLAGNTPTVGTGLWTLVSGTGTISSASAANSGVTGLGVGANVFRWTISNSPCTATSDDVSITRANTPSNAAAGPDQTVCATTATLAGNTPSVGTGAWTLVSGAGTITTSSSPTSGVTGLGVGANVFSWTISNSPCVSSSSNIDNITITRTDTPSIANTGADQIVCATTATLEGNTPTVGTGNWTLVSGTGTISSASAANSGVTGLGVGANVFRWTISNSPCVSSSSNIDNITITRTNTPSNAQAGADQIVCATTATLAGNTPTVGTGNWTLVSGTGTISSPSSPTSGITGLALGVNIFRWTISNAPCTATSDDITITRPDSSYIISTNAGVTYQIDVGGPSVYIPNNNTSYPCKTVDINTVVDENCDFSLTYTNEQNIPSPTPIVQIPPYNYYHNGNCGYDSAACPSQGSPISVQNGVPYQIEDGGLFASINETNYLCQTRDIILAHDGNCGTDTTYNIYSAPVSLITSDNNYNYYWDGNCGVNPVPIPCTSNSGSLLSNTPGVIYYGGPSVNINGINYPCQTADSNTVDDGNCGTYTTYTNLTSFSYGIYITSYNNNNYYWDGNCGVNSVPIPCTSSQSTTTESGVPYACSDGGPCQNINGIDYPCQTGDKNTVDDGNCIITINYTNTNNLPNATLITSDNNYNYYWNGGCGVTTTSNCPSYGTILSTIYAANYDYSTGGSPQMVNIGMNSYVCQKVDIITIANGNCDSIKTFTNATYIAANTFIIQIPPYNYYSDGACGYNAVPCPMSQDVISTNSGAVWEIVDGGGFVTIYGINYPCQTVNVNTVANGNCGTYITYTDMHPIPSGTIIDNGGGTIYYHDGNCGFY